MTNRYLDQMTWIFTMDRQLFYVSSGKNTGRTDPFRFRKKRFLLDHSSIGENRLHLPPVQEKLLQFLQQYPQGIALNSITKISGLKNVSSAARKLHSAGFCKSKKNKANNSLRRMKKLSPWRKVKSAEAKLTDKQENTDRIYSK